MPSITERNVTAIATAAAKLEQADRLRSPISASTRKDMRTAALDSLDKSWRTRGFIFALLGASLCFGPSESAEIRYDKGRVNAALIEGDIMKGDYEKVRDFILGNPVGAPEKIVQEIFLATPGGDVAEAIKIGHLVRELKLGTTIPSKFPSRNLLSSSTSYHGIVSYDNYLCASACFFIFVAGVRRENESYGLFEPMLGIRRPYFSESDLRNMNVDSAMAATARAKAIVDSYLKDMGAPQKYSDIIFSIPKDDIRFISKSEFEVDFQGFIPELSNWIAARCERLTKGEKALWELVQRQHDAVSHEVVVDIENKIHERSICEHDEHFKLVVGAIFKSIEASKAKARTSVK